jgi:hypothetical protein
MRYTYLKSRRSCRKSTPKSYRGAENARVDADWCIQLMKEALDEAFTASLNAYQSHVLKLFMAPEF